MINWDIRWTSERSVLAQMPESINDPQVPNHLAAWIRSAQMHSIRAVVPSSSGVLIVFEAPHHKIEDLWEDVVMLLVSFGSEGNPGVTAKSSPARDIRIPVCYDQQLAPDLYDVAKQLQCSPEHVIEMHLAASYRVSAIGFTPGFGYLKSLHRSLRIPRKETPRIRVPAGSVAIAEDMTAVYPFECAGGWRLIGRTPMVLFNPSMNDPSMLRVGDSVRFERISLEEFNQNFVAGEWGFIDG